jgi:hypothetical protein
MPTALDARLSVHDHSRPLDIVIVALEEADCAWCAAFLRRLKAHLEEAIPAGPEALN